MATGSPLASTADRSGVRSETLRNTNLSTILRELHRRGPLTRSELGQLTGLTRSSIGALVGELTKARLIVDRGTAADGQRGRPSAVTAVDAEHNVVFAAHVAVDSLAVASIGLGGTVHRTVRSQRTRRRLGLDATIADIVQHCNELSSTLPAGCTVHAVGVGVVGLVRSADNSVALAPNLGWSEAPLGQKLQAALTGNPPVTVANDANLSALAEVRRGAAMGVDEVVSVWGEVGVGGGLLTRGELFLGSNGLAGEVGHMPVNPDGRRCGCGAIGCWETEVGAAALLRRAALPDDGGRPALDALLDRSQSGDASALAALRDHARWLGIGLSGLVNLFNPSVVVLGGLFQRMHHVVAEDLQAELDRRVLPAALAGLCVVPSALGADAPLIGAAEMAFEATLASPLAMHGGDPRRTNR
jgi:predicted NBD/HSP70 family sugar kinase